MMKYIVYVNMFARPLPLDQREDEFLFSGPLGPWTGREGTETLVKATKKYLGVELNQSSQRQVAIGFKDQLLYKQIKAYKEEEGLDKDNKEEFKSLELDLIRHIINRQSAYSSWTAQAHYAVDSSFWSGLGLALIYGFETASLAWHNMLKVGGPIVEGLGKHQQGASDMTRWDKNKRTQSDKGSSQAAIKEEDVARQIQLGLTRLYSHQAGPRSTSQQKALEVVLRQPKTSVIILPTIGGKSTLFMLPVVLLASRTVVVVMPYVELLDHHLDKA